MSEVYYVAVYDREYDGYGSGEVHAVTAKKAANLAKNRDARGECANVFYCERRINQKTGEITYEHMYVVPRKEWE